MEEQDPNIKDVTISDDLINRSKEEILNFTNTLRDEDIPTLIGRVNWYLIRTNDQLNCAKDILMLEILANTLVNKLKSIDMDVPIDTTGASEEI